MESSFRTHCKALGVSLSKPEDPPHPKQKINVNQKMRDEREEKKKESTCKKGTN